MKDARIGEARLTRNKTLYGEDTGSSSAAADDLVADGLVVLDPAAAVVNVVQQRRALLSMCGIDPADC